MSERKDYKETLNLPKTDFPMKADLPKKEPEILKFWDEISVYKKIIEKRKESPLFILHDGPPYANGHIHLGTALNKILKDFIIKSKTISGFKSPYLPGWDCHGLPIEHKVDQILGEKKKKMKIPEIRKECELYAKKFIEIQREEFKRLGVFGEWENPYLTMNSSYEASIINYLGEFFDKGYIYRGKKPVLWCFNCITALAEAEIEYHEHGSPSIWVKFPLKSDLSEKFPEIKNKKISVLIWTTTPWTLPANLAIAFHPEFDYSIFELDGENFIAANKLIPEIIKKAGSKSQKEIVSFKGKELEGFKAQHPFYERESIFVLASYVTFDQGTGCVHTAPGHGEEDFLTGIEYNLEIYNPVDEKGKFRKDVPLIGGKNVFEANQLIIDELKKRKLLFHEEKIEHSYPHCWRCKNPLIFRATEQWFISMDHNDFRKRAQDEVKKVKWIPEWGEERMNNMLSFSPDWCISRQRIWGVPIPAFYCNECGNVIANKESIKRVAEIFGKEGSNSWFEKDAEYFLPSNFKCENCNSSSFRKETDILDVWFESGSSHSVLEQDEDHVWPADVYIEGNDQYRGWFNKSLLVALGVKGSSPFKTVITHGWVLDEQGRAMSKSLENVISPQEIIEKKGAEILRLWVAMVDFKEDVKLGDEILERLVEAYRKIRNTWRFMVGNLYDFNGEKEISEKNYEPIDRYILQRKNDVAKKISKSYGDYQYHSIFHAIYNFFTVDLSSFYLDVIKDRLYCSHPMSSTRKAARATIYEILKDTLILMSSILPFTTEEAWKFIPNFDGKEISVHLNKMPDFEKKWISKEEETEWELLISLRDRVLKSIEGLRKSKQIGNSLETDVFINSPEKNKNFFEKYKNYLPDLFLVSNVKLNFGNFEQISLEVKKSDGKKCSRCWNYKSETGKSPDFPDLCPRCISVIQNL